MEPKTLSLLILLLGDHLTKVRIVSSSNGETCVKKQSQMILLQISRLRLLAGLVVLFAFGGDIVADSIVDSRGEHCAAQTCPSDSHHEKTPCSHCSCAVHNGSVIATNNGVHVSADVQPSVFILIRDEPAQVGPPAAIDHPPQLANN